MVKYYNKPHVHKSRITGHWIVDFNIFRANNNPFYKQGFRKWEDAITCVIAYGLEFENNAYKDRGK